MKRLKILLFLVAFSILLMVGCNYYSPPFVIGSPEIPINCP